MLLFIPRVWVADCFNAHSTAQHAVRQEHSTSHHGASSPQLSQQLLLLQRSPGLSERRMLAKTQSWKLCIRGHIVSRSAALCMSVYV